MNDNMIQYNGNPDTSSPGQATGEEMVSRFQEPEIRRLDDETDGDLWCD